MKCTFCCAAESYNIAQLMEDGKGYTKPFNNVVSIDKGNNSILFVFDYGVLVFWNFSPQDEQNYIKKLKPYAQKPLEHIIFDQCNYRYDAEFSIEEESDSIALDDKSLLVKLSCSYALSQSVKLEYFENSVDKTIDSTKFLTRKLQEEGSIRLSHKKLKCYMGALFTQRTNINLHSNILDEPEFLWRQPRYSTYYEEARNFMDIEVRINILNTRLNVIYELYEMLSNELKHSHSSRLEMTIIILILFEVAILLIKEALHLF